MLFLDEPTTGLDPVSRSTIWEEVRKLNDEGTTVFLTTQYLEEADQLADRVGIIDDGRMAAEGTPAALKARGRARRTSRSRSPRATPRARRAEVLARFGEPLPRARRHADGRARSTAPRDVAPIVRALDDAGLAVESLELVEPTLDDVFVAKTGRHLEGARADAAAPRSRRRAGRAA